MRSVTILGATGSVGTSTLDLVERAPDRFRVKALTANCDVTRLADAAIRTRAELAVVADEAASAVADSAAVEGAGAGAVRGQPRGRDRPSSSSSSSSSPLPPRPAAPS